MSLDSELNDFIKKLESIHADKWREFAACIDSPIDLWFDESRVAEAKAMCEVCAVRIECLDDSVLNGDVGSMRGGLSEAQRVGVSIHRKRHRSSFDADLKRALGL